MSARKRQVFVSHNFDREIDAAYRAQRERSLAELAFNQTANAQFLDAIYSARNFANASGNVNTHTFRLHGSGSISPAAMESLRAMVIRRNRSAHQIPAASTEVTPLPLRAQTIAPVTRIQQSEADRMENVASYLAIFGKGTRRALEETIADYRFEFDEAVRQAADPEILDRINRTYWGGFVSVVLRSVWRIFERVLKAWKSAR